MHIPLWRLGWCCALPLLLPLYAWGHGWLLAPVGFGPGQRALSGAGLVANKGAQALASNPAEVASLRGLEVFASGSFALTSARLQARPDTRHRFSASPQVAAAWRLPEGFGVGLLWARGEVAGEPPRAQGQLHIPLHRVVGNVSWAWAGLLRLGVEGQLGVTEGGRWPLSGGGTRWKGGRLAMGLRTGVSVDLAPKRHTLACVWESGLNLQPRGGGGRLSTPYSVALSSWHGGGSWEFEGNLAYGWQKGWADGEGAEQAREGTWGVRAGMGLWLTPVIQLRAGAGVFMRAQPKRASWAQPMEAWSASLSAGALWRYGPLRIEAAIQTQGAFRGIGGERGERGGAGRVQQQISHLFSLGAGVAP